MAYAANRKLNRQWLLERPPPCGGRDRSASRQRPKCRRLRTGFWHLISDFYCRPRRLDCTVAEDHLAERSERPPGPSEKERANVSRNGCIEGVSTIALSGRPQRFKRADGGKSRRAGSAPRDGIGGLLERVVRRTLPCSTTTSTLARGTTWPHRFGWREERCPGDSVRSNVGATMDYGPLT